MQYISKGALLRPSTEETLHVSRCGNEYTLTDKLSKLWLNGRYAVAETEDYNAQQLERLAHLGLVEIDYEDNGHAPYRLLSNCVICPARLRPIRPLLTGSEVWLWRWITRAGFRLTISELVFLTAEQIEPAPTLIGQENWHNLIHTIYTTDTIEDGVLIAAMERSPACQSTVDSLLGLLRKKRILLI